MARWQKHGRVYLVRIDGEWMAAWEKVTWSAEVPECDDSSCDKPAAWADDTPGGSHYHLCFKHVADVKAWEREQQAERAS